VKVRACVGSVLKAGFAMRMPTGVKRPAGKVRRMELVRQSRVRRCWEREVGLGEWIRWGRRRRRKPEERETGVSKSDLLIDRKKMLTSVCVHDFDRSAIALERNRL